MRPENLPLQKEYIFLLMNILFK